MSNTRLADVSHVPTPWLAEERGNAADWATQLWVRSTGQRIDLRLQPWLAGLVGDTIAVGPSGRLAGLAGRRGGPVAAGPA